MSGPIIRSAGSEQYANNWDNVFGKKSKPKQASSSASKPAKKKTAKKKKKGD